MNFNTFFENSQIKLKDQKIGKKLQINLIMVLKSKFGDNMLCYDKKHNRTFFTNSLLKSYLSKMLSNLKSNSNFYYMDDDLSTILEFQIKSHLMNNGKDQVQLEFIKKRHYNNEVLDLTSDDE